MRIHIAALVALLALVLVCVGCPSSETDTPPADDPPAERQDAGATKAPAPEQPVPETPEASPAGDAGATPDGEPSAEEVPVAEDFEDEAEGAITAENYQAELGRIETEIGE